MAEAEKIILANPRQDEGTATAIDIFQKLVAAARSPDRTMAALSQWIINNQGRAAGLSISSLAQQTGVSETTVFRFCKLLGLNGYKDLRFALAESRGLALGSTARRREHGCRGHRGTSARLDHAPRRRGQFGTAPQDDEPDFAAGPGGGNGGATGGEPHPSRRLRQFGAGRLRCLPEAALPRADGQRSFRPARARGCDGECPAGRALLRRHLFGSHARPDRSLRDGGRTGPAPHRHHQRREFAR